ncbi:MAG TPA: HAMP domain-containing sensor histidine kinase, partial [Cryomorphaceae bacterium]|nr:HAMP domain-containing sensor histidine kinase [Cryomorphaceae bacterium]
ATPTGAQIEVKDFGIGIKENELESIFEIFSKSDENFDLQSTGLGLYIVKESIYKIGGTVQVASEYGKGSTFTIQVPDMPM